MASVSSSLTHTVPAKSHVFQISFHPDSAVKTFATCHVSSDVYVYARLQFYQLFCYRYFCSVGGAKTLITAP